MNKLKSVTIGKNIRVIGKNAFLNCKKLRKIIIKSKLLTKTSVKSGAFKIIYAKPEIKCPGGKKQLYKKILLKRGLKKSAVFK